MKFKKVFAAVLALVSFMNAPISALAYIDVTETVRANSGEHIDVGSVTVENSNVAVDVYTSDKAASVDVAGDVSLKTNDLGAVVSVEGDYASANIAGDVTGDAGNTIASRTDLICSKNSASRSAATSYKAFTYLLTTASSEISTDNYVSTFNAGIISSSQACFNFDFERKKNSSLGEIFCWNFPRNWS